MPAHKSPNPKTDVFNVRTTPAQAKQTRAAAAARGMSAGEFIRAAVERELQTLDLDGNPILATREEADRMAELRREFGLNVPAGPERARRAAEAKRALTARGEAIGAGTKPPPSPGTKPAPVRRESEREELERLRAEAYAQLTDYERADAAKIKDPVARARFVVARLARRAKR